MKIIKSHRAVVIRLSGRYVHHVSIRKNKQNIQNKNNQTANERTWNGKKYDQNEMKIIKMLFLYLA